MSTAVEPIAKPKKGAIGGRSQEEKEEFQKRSQMSAGTVIRRKGRIPCHRTLLKQVTGVPTGDRAKMLANIRKGLPFKVILDLEKAYAAPRKELSEVLSISVSTLTRRKKEGRLHADESDRVVRLARLKDAAVEMMQGDDQAAIQWLHTPLEVLGGETPMEHASTEMGARDVEDLIGRIRHGVFS